MNLANSDRDRHVSQNWRQAYSEDVRNFNFSKLIMCEKKASFQSQVDRCNNRSLNVTSVKLYNSDINI